MRKKSDFDIYTPSLLKICVNYKFSNVCSNIFIRENILSEKLQQPSEGTEILIFFVEDRECFLFNVFCASISQVISSTEQLHNESLFRSKSLKFGRYFHMNIFSHLDTDIDFVNLSNFPIR